MEELFTQMVDKSIAAAVLIVVLLLLRLCFRRLPKRAFRILWILVGIKLLLPLGFTSRLEVLPQKLLTPVLDQVQMRTESGMRSAGYRLEKLLDPDRSDGAEWTEPGKLQMEEASSYDGQQKDPSYRAGRLQQSVPAYKNAGVTASKQSGIHRGAWGRRLLQMIWLTGMSALLGYMLFRLVLLRRSVRFAVHETGNIWRLDGLTTPFVFGVVSPKIYLSFDMEGDTFANVLAHERAHIRCGDHVLKLIAFVLLCVYWMNPLMWIAYVAFSKDVEYACDERVIAGMDRQERSIYSRSLLACSDRHRFQVYPLAFAEGNVMKRIKNILNYHKPGAYGSAGILVIALIAGACFLSGGKPAEVAQKHTDTQADTDTPELQKLQADAAAKKAMITEQEKKILAMAQKNLEAESTKVADEAGIRELAENNVNQKEKTGKTETPVTEDVFADYWAVGFEGRNLDVMRQNSTPEVQKSWIGMGLTDEAFTNFGYSSPWPMIAESHVIADCDSKHAVIYYYAVDSEPHTYVWREEIAFEPKDDWFVVTSDQLKYLDQIKSAEEFELAYPGGSFPEQMKYVSEWKDVLYQHYAEDETGTYAYLEDPARSAEYLLNLSKDAVEKDGYIVTEEDTAEVGFILNDGSDIRLQVTMKRYAPKAQDPGIWLPEMWKKEKI